MSPYTVRHPTLHESNATPWPRKTTCECCSHASADVPVDVLASCASNPSTISTDALLFRDIRAVTVWFQNKRQYGRRQAIRRTAKHDPLASPFTAPPGKTIHTARSSSPPSDDLSRASDALGTPTPRKRRRDSSTPDARARPTPVTRTLSLDQIAARAELPCASDHSPADATTPPGPRRAHSAASLPYLRAPPPPPPRALWETMPSSPPRPSSPELAPSPLLDFDSAFGHRLKRRRTLEWACARERAGGHQELGLVEEDGDPLVLDLGGDTDVETEPDVHEAVTPRSYGRGGPGADIVRTESWEEERMVDGDKENRPQRWMRLRNEAEAKMDVDPKRSPIPEARDDDMMDAALALCGLGGRL